MVESRGYWRSHQVPLRRWQAGHVLLLEEDELQAGRSFQQNGKLIELAELAPRTASHGDNPQGHLAERPEDA